jgi:PAS domain S-box-containing protein
VWRDDFLWCAPGYFLAAGVAVPAALAIEAQAYGIVPLTIAPLYLTYRSYKTYLRRIEDEQTHARELAAEKTRLAVERERLAVTLGNIGDGVITTGSRGEILLLNRTAEDLTGMTQDQASGGAFLDAVDRVAPAAHADFAHAIRHVLAHGVRVQVPERSVLTVAEGGRQFECSGSPLRHADGTTAGSIWVFHDVTDAIRLEQERSRAVRLESLAVLAGGLAHDFNNILTGITGNISLARLDLPGYETVTNRLAQAERACHRARGLTSQLLTFAKGGAPVKTEASIRALVEETATFVLRGSTVAPSFVVGHELWPVDVDVGQISQVISNLVINAQQAMPAGGVVTIELANVERPSAELRDGVHLPAGRFVSISIADQGVGIPQEHLHRIFDPYFTTKPTGSGLGLATTYSIITAHGGHIGVESTVDAGSRFLLYLPAAGGRSAPVVDGAPACTAADGGRALIVDDEEMVRHVAAAMFGRLGYETVTARDGAEAVKRVREAMRGGRRFDVVLMDLTIPAGMGGREAVVLLREIDPDLRVVASSGYADDPIAVDCEGWGFCGMIAKPYIFEDVQEALARLRPRVQASRRTTAG